MKGIKSSGFAPIIAQAIVEMEEVYGEFSSLNQINLAELCQRRNENEVKRRSENDPNAEVVSPR